MRNIFRLVERTMNKKIILITLTLAILIGLAGIIYFISKPAPNKVTLYGNVEVKEVQLAFQTSGQIIDIRTDEGHLVKTGDILAKLDTRTYTAQLNAAKAQVEMAQADLNKLRNGARPSEIDELKFKIAGLKSNLNNAEQAYKRALTLSRSNTISKAALDNALNQRNVARSELESAESKLTTLVNGARLEDIALAEAKLKSAYSQAETAQINLDNAILKAPQDGIIISRNYEVGSVISSGAPIFTLSLPQAPRVKAYISETMLNKIWSGQLVKVKIDGNNSKIYTGTIGFISPRAEFTPKTVETPDLRVDLVYKFWISIANPDKSLHQGMPVTIELVEQKHIDKPAT